MSEVFTPLCDVDPMSERIKVKARCVSIWHSHAPDKPTPVWSLDCVIQDEQGNRIQCTIRKDDMPKYEGLLQEGVCYRISNFGVGENGGKYPLLKHKYKIVFYKNTALTRIDSFDQNNKGFKFEAFTDFVPGRINEADTVDIIGTIVSLGDLIPFNNHGMTSRRRILQLEDVEGNQLECCFFDGVADKFNQCTSKRESSGHVVVIVQLGKVKYWNGKPSVGLHLYSSKIYVNEDLPEVTTFKQRYKKKDCQDENEFKIALFSPTTYVLTPKNFFKGATKKIVGAIRDSYDEYTCVIYAKVHKIHKEYGWYYPACKKCSKRATLSDASASGSKASGSGGRRKFWKCDTHGQLNGVVYRYKIIVRVIDEFGSASLVLFDNMVHKLLNDTPCWELMEKYHYAAEDVFPSEIDVIVGKKMLFKFSYTEFNITNNNHVYQVKMLSDDREMISVFKEGFLSVENEEDQELDKQAKDVAALSGPDSDNVDGGEFVTPETVKWAGKTSEGMFGYSDDMKSLKAISGGSAGDGSSGSGKRNIIDLDEFNEEEYDAKRAKQPDGENQPEVQVKIEKE
ncbi:replication protein A 70 kDa DNA-binding subunit B [Artemisia annua]|uniref:Replication protein A 70 kDa DNA-binding subunit B n=1 Tax=Artemisia annua TaxID=35608 RepID=A0A2U1L0P7_ARTAN|nr:replication protein A 70 kDa DNA-binding subunit B [Artemisia annua]